MSDYQRQGAFGGFGMFPPVIKTLIIINVAVFLCENFLFNIFRVGNYSLEDIFFSYSALFPLGEGSNFYPWQIITYQFMHGGFGHLFFNLFALWMFGSEIESLWGSKRFLVFYLLCGIGAGLIQLFVSPLFTSVGPTVGASGAIYGVMLAFALTFPDRQIFIFPLFIPIKAKYLIILMVAMDLIMGFSQSTGVAHFAHLGGGATGFLLIKFGDKAGIYRFFEKLFSKKKQSNIYEQQPLRPQAKIFQSNWHHKSEPKPEPKVSNGKLIVNGEEITQAKVDEILDKISNSGYQNLSEKDKHILFELSKKIK